jgi:hypothetical protein
MCSTLPLFNYRKLKLKFSLLLLEKSFVSFFPVRIGMRERGREFLPIYLIYHPLVTACQILCIIYFLLSLFYRNHFPLFGHLFLLKTLAKNKDGKWMEKAWPSE